MNRALSFLQFGHFVGGLGGYLVISLTTKRESVLVTLFLATKKVYNFFFSLVHVLEHPDVCDGGRVVSEEVHGRVDDVDILVRAVVFH